MQRNIHVISLLGFPGGSEGKESACSAGDLGSILGSGRSPVEGNGNPLLYSCRENLMNRGAWLATVHTVANSWTRLKQLSTQEPPVCEHPSRGQDGFQGRGLWVG